LLLFFPFSLGKKLFLYSFISVDINRACDMEVRWCRRVLHICNIFIGRAYMTLCLHTIDSSYHFKLLRAPISLFPKKLTACRVNEIQGSIHGGETQLWLPRSWKLRFHHVAQSLHSMYQLVMLLHVIVCPKLQRGLWSSCSDSMCILVMFVKPDTMLQNEWIFTSQACKLSFWLLSIATHPLAAAAPAKFCSDSVEHEWT